MLSLLSYFSLLDSKFSNKSAEWDIKIRIKNGLERERKEKREEEREREREREERDLVLC